MDRIFIQPQYTTHYREATRAKWTNGAQPNYHAFCLLGGKITYDIGVDSGEFDGQGFLLLEPSVTASISGRSVRFLTLAIAPAMMLDYAVRTRLAGAGAQVAFRSSALKREDRLTRLANDLSHELKIEEAGQQLVVAALIEQFVVQLLRHHSNLRRADELELSRFGLIDRRIRRAVELMHANLAHDLPLGEIAAAAYLSTFHFARLFKKLTNYSPHAYLAALRAAHAQTLLAETDFSIAQISARVGYSSPSHFTKAFREATGLTPRAFRAALIKRRN
jgi:AraC family transcriptional regulator